MSCPGFVVAGTETGVGKTSIVVGLLRALCRRGRVVQPFKVGPDFIDPGHHRAAVGCRSNRCSSKNCWSHNLDGWMLDRQTNRDLYARHTEGADVAVVEGVMGLFDGYAGGGEAGSTAEMAKWLGLPVVLVVDAWTMARSAAAMAEGYAGFDAELDVAGVIFNRVAGPEHLAMLREAMEEAGDGGGALEDVAVLGGLPRDEELEIPQRHLGLWLPEAMGEEATGDGSDAYVGRLADWVDEHLEVEQLADTVAAPGPSPDPGTPIGGTTDAPPLRTGGERPRIGVAYDQAFCFYYRDNLDRLEEAGAELVPFSPMADAWPDGLDGLYLGGGYPELHADALADNESMRRAIRRFSAAGRPIYAECGGLMYLGESLEDASGERHPMCGVFPYDTRMGRLRIDYGEVSVGAAAPFWSSGATARGHLFHKSEIRWSGARAEAAVETCYRVRTRDDEAIREGFVQANTLATYLHLHFGSRPELAVEFVEACRA